MEIDERCCGTGTCIIDKDGKCWCGQQWDGEKMCFQPLASDGALEAAQSPDSAEPKQL